MRSLTYSFRDVSLRFISTLTGVSDYNGDGLGTITVTSSTLPTKTLGSADGNTMTLKMPGSRAKIRILVPQVSTLAKRLWNNYMLLSKANSTVWNTNQVWLRHKDTGMEILLGFVSYELPPDLVFDAQGVFTEFTFLAETMTVTCL